jgi:hypothetical protein
MNNIDIEVKSENIKNIKKEQNKKKTVKTVMRLFHKKDDKYKIMLVQTDNDKIYITITDNDKNKQNIALSLEECSTLKDVIDVFVKSSIMKKIKQ